MKTKWKLLNAFYLIIIINRIQGCKIGFDSMSILDCWQDNKPLQLDIKDTLHFVPHGTKCLQNSENGVSVIECQESKWTSVAGNDSELLLQRHTRHKRGLFAAFACVLTLFSCLWGGRSNPDPDPPYIPCKKDIYATSFPIQTYAVVHWDEPIATDRHHKTYTPKRYGKGPGHSFSEGTTKVVYVAKNKRGEEGRCEKYIHVEVKRCTPVPSPIKNGYMLCHPSTDFVYGSVCNFGCYDGFELSPPGLVSMKCENTSRWSAIQPICKRFECPPLDVIKGSTISCTKGRFYQSVCTYTCEVGFDMPPRVSKTVVCTRYKTWRTNGSPICIDVEPPKFDFCPSVVVRGTDPGINTSSVFWKPPSVVDNSNSTIIAKQQKGPYSESKLTAGIYKVVYGAHDSEGNEAKSCQFNVIVKDVRCYRLHATPNMRFTCPNGYRTGSGCTISCDPGTVLDGLQYVQCDESPKGLFGEWIWRSKTQPMCKRTNKCVPLRPPKNGAVVCDNWIGGSFCQFQCKKGTDMANVNWRRLHTCSQLGKWFPDPIIKACNELRRPHETLAVETSFYFDGECSDMETKEIIANNFITSIKSSFFKEASSSTQCSPSNVQITCGESERIRRAVEKGNQTKLILSAKLTLMKTLENETFYDLHKNYVSLYNNFKAHIMQEATSIFKRNVTVLSIENHGIEVNCPVGTVKTEQNINCVECPEGTYYRTGTERCEFCDKGTYQHETGQLHCHRCPHATTTSDKGATSSDDCESACPPGTFSLDGLHPCSPCENGYYQTATGQSDCRECSGGMTTLNIGARSISECQEFDIALPQGFSKNITSMSDEMLHVDEFSLSLWIRKVSVNEENNLSISFIDDKGKGVWSYKLSGTLYDADKSYENMTVDIQDTKWHHVMIISRKCTAQIYLDKIPVTNKQELNPCQQYAFNRIEVKADEKFAGAISQLNIWSNLEPYRILAKCFSQYRGDVFAWKLFGQSILDGAFIQITSTCDDFNNCVSSPCTHGTCIDEIGTFSCICDAGYMGTQCDVNKDDCLGNVCMDGATCIDGINTYSCQCPENITGFYCEIQMMNGGWSEWGPWTECSVTCGAGIQSRKRLCNNPYPDSGGNDCTGYSEDHQVCNDTVCRSCPEMKDLANGSVKCSYENESISCNITCNDGYEFDIAPLENYICGPETFHEWNFETTDNPSRKLPTCVGVEMPEHVEVQYTASYKDLVCTNDNIAKEVKDKIETIAKHVVFGIPCIISETCKLSHLEVVDCNAQERNRRNADNAGFALTLSTRPNDDNGEEKLGDLQSAFQKIQDAAENGEFTIQIIHEQFNLDNGLASLSGNLQCGHGMTRVKHYCVPCGTGAFLNKHICESCAYGKYQDEIGQTSCKSCPKGRTTLGMGSASIVECSVEKVLDIEEETKVLTIVLATSIPVAVVILLICMYRRLKSTMKKPTDPAKMCEYPMHHTTSDPLGTPNRRFLTK